MIYRHKLTLSLDTPDGVKTGYSVVEERAAMVSMPASGAAFGMKGEALYLDLGPGRRPLIALLTRVRRQGDKVQNHIWTEGPDTEFFGVCFPPGAKILFQGLDVTLDGIAKCRNVIDLKPTELPDLVTFEDVSKPDSIRLVDSNNLEATLGPGVKWKSITIQSVDEPVTTGIMQRLPWLGHFVNLKVDMPDIWPSENDPTADDHISNRAFMR